MKPWAVFASSVLVLAAAGCRKQQGLSVGQLPVSQGAARVVDRDPREITVAVDPPASYSILGGMTDAEGLAHALTRAKTNLGTGIPVAIPATPETRFALVWHVAEAVSKNGMSPRFDVRVPEIDWPKYLEFEVAGTVPEPSGATRIRCSTSGVEIGGRLATQPINC